MKRVSMLLAAIMAAAPMVPASATMQESDIKRAMAKETACNLKGWSRDREPQGLNVRAGPDIHARIVGNIPFDPGKPDEDYQGFGIGFRIIGSRNGWIKIRNAADGYQRPGLANKPIYNGEGWVHGSRVTFYVQSSRVRALPLREAPLIAEMSFEVTHKGETSWEPMWLTEVARVEGVDACDGKWALVRYRGKPPMEGDKLLAPKLGARDGAGWVTGICPAQETTCDMRTDD
jgi:hypothetical protein